MLEQLPHECRNLILRTAGRYPERFAEERHHVQQAVSMINPVCPACLQQGLRDYTGTNHLIIRVKCGFCRHLLMRYRCASRRR